MVAAQRAETSVDIGAETSVHTSPRQRNSPLKRGEGNSKICKRSRASAAIDIESDSDSKMHKREKLAMTTRWRAPKVRCPLQTISCQTKKDFNNHYGLDTEGKDPRLLKDSDVSKGDWLAVFSHSRDTSSYRVKCSSICPEQYKDLLIFYMKVYQKRPTNMEVNVSFARAYVLQFSPRTVKAGRLIVAKDEHATCLKKLEAGKVQQRSDEKFGKALSLLDEQISATKLKLASIAEDDPAEVEILADVVKEKEMQHNLLQEMLHRIEVGRQAYICPTPPSVMSPTLDNFTLPAKCAGCGLTFCGKFDFLTANMSCGSSGRSKVFSRVKTKDESSLERLQVVRNEGIGGGDHGLTADTVNLKPATASVDVPVTATKVMIGTEWLENKVQDLSAANEEEEKVAEEEAKGDNVEEEAE
ncbi:hypothetical protein L7F22_013761 [Adiantum nelumboides]|nr:hypothetical protein [Adiantum nelumboides]